MKNKNKPNIAYFKDSRFFPGGSGPKYKEITLKNAPIYSTM